MVAPTNIRFAEPTQESLTRFVHRTGQTKSSVINTAVDEWLRMQDQVWTVAESWLAHDPTQRTAATVADAVGIPVSMVEAALAYWADYRDEIDDVLDRHRVAQDEALAAWERRQALASA